VLFRKGEKMKPIAKRIFGSLSDHSDDGNCRWNVYGLQFVVPEAFLLDENSLKTGCLELRFYDRRDEIEIVRVSLAEMLLKQDDIRSWLKSYYRKRLKAFECEFTNADAEGHPGIRCHGRVPLKKRLHKVFQKPKHLHCLAWCCVETDKLFVFRVTSKNERDENFETYSKLVRCCASVGRADEDGEPVPNLRDKITTKITSVQ